MRARDLQRLKPGTKVRLKLTANNPDYVESWSDKTTYINAIGPDGASLRSSKQVRTSTSYGFFFPYEILPVKD